MNTKNTTMTYTAARDGGDGLTIFIWMGNRLIDVIYDVNPKSPSTYANMLDGCYRDVVSEHVNIDDELDIVADEIMNTNPTFH